MSSDGIRKREEKSGNSALVKRADLLLFFAVIIVGAVIFLVYRLSLSQGKIVRVSVDGEVLCELPLEEDVTREFGTPYGTNTIVIKDGEASVKEADCPDKICVKHKAVSMSGETIICLPHKLVVEVAE